MARSNPGLPQARENLAAQCAIHTTSAIRRPYSMKEPDAIVTAMILEGKLELLTPDRQLVNRIKEIRIYVFIKAYNYSSFH